ncbi:MAG: efflux RND transporter periplasmic adaptor subunit [Opitutaceae bacterium]
MKALLPILIIGAAIGLFSALVMLKPEPETVEVIRPITSVEVITVQPSSVQLTVESQGTLLPSVETDLIAEVSGRVIGVADSFRVGNRFSKGDLLLTIDPADYVAAAAARAAEVANAELALAQEAALAEQAAADWDSLGDGKPSDLTLRKPQLKQASALLASAQAALQKANRDLERTQITAPYDGVVLSKHVDLGQFVTANPGNPISRIYSTQSAEIRLPMTEEEATFLDRKSKRQRFVQLSRPNADVSATWTARLARIEDNINPNSRLLYAVAELTKPFEPSSDLPALRRGTFMKGSIEGRSLQNVYSLPRYALRGSNSLYVLTDENTLSTRKVEIVKSDSKQVIINSGLEPGDRVAISPIAYFVEGMPVEIVEAEANGTAKAP